MSGCGGAVCRGGAKSAAGNAPDRAAGPFGKAPASAAATQVARDHFR